MMRLHKAKGRVLIGFNVSQDREVTGLLNITPLWLGRGRWTGRPHVFTGNCILVQTEAEVQYRIDGYRELDAGWSELSSSAKLGFWPAAPSESPKG